MALLAAASACGYTLADGMGARVNGSGPGYALWMFVLNAITMQSIAFHCAVGKPYDGLREHWSVMAGGGAMSMSASFIVIWAITQAPIALLAALRETSVLFGAGDRNDYFERSHDRLARAGIGVCGFRHGVGEDRLTA